MADHACSVGRDTLAELHQVAHDLVNDLAAIRMHTEFVSETASKNQVDPLLASIRSDLEQVRLAVESATNHACLLTRRVQDALEDEATPV
jgi:hypothetical protein